MTQGRISALLCSWWEHKEAMNLLGVPGFYWVVKRVLVKARSIGCVRRYKFTASYGFPKNDCVVERIQIPFREHPSIGSPRHKFRNLSLRALNTNLEKKAPYGSRDAFLKPEKREGEREKKRDRESLLCTILHWARESSNA